VVEPWAASVKEFVKDAGAVNWLQEFQLRIGTVDRQAHGVPTLLSAKRPPGQQVLVVHPADPWLDAEAVGVGLECLVEVGHDDTNLIERSRKP
jgi:hypothetical protein